MLAHIRSLQLHCAFAGSPETGCDVRYILARSRCSFLTAAKSIQGGAVEISLPLDFCRESTIVFRNQVPHPSEVVEHGSMKARTCMTFEDILTWSYATQASVGSRSRDSQCYTCVRAPRSFKPPAKLLSHARSLSTNCISQRMTRKIRPRQFSSRRGISSLLNVTSSPPLQSATQFHSDPLQSVITINLVM
ncbi:hypothetical protein C8R43DRAFT_161668 [Mycena crocata]|nr:hypothetical protein C8R43DRAFT_161668 [Mycena crocata]